MADYFEEARQADTTVTAMTTDSTTETTALAAASTEGPTLMAYPPGVSLATITIGAGRTMFGAAPKLISATVTPIFKGTPHVVHAASGWAFYPTPQTFRVENGEELTFELPHVNAEGWRDTAGNEFPALLESGERDRGWAYHAKFTVVGGSGQDAVPHRYEKVFQPLVGQTEPLDIDLVPDGQIGVPVSAPVAAVSSIAGLTGVVTEEQLSALGLGGASDPEIAALVQDETTSTGSALAATYATKAEAQTSKRDADRDAALRWARFQAGDTAAPLDVIYVGDSTAEGARATTAANRWIDQVTAKLRERHQPAGVKGGAGYRPAMYAGGIPFQGSTWDYWSSAAASTLYRDTFTRTGELASSAPETGTNWSTTAGVYTLDGTAAVTQTAGGTVAYAGLNTAADREVTTTVTFGTLNTTAQYFVLLPMYASGVGDKVQLEGVIASNRSDWRISQRIGGTATTLATYSTPPVPIDPSGDTVTASVRVEGLTVTATVNGAVLTATLTQAAKDALGAAQHAGFQTPGIGSRTEEFTVVSTGAQSVKVLPTLNQTHGLGLRALDLGPTLTAAQAVTTFTGTAVDVVTTSRSGGGTLTASIDGGAPVTIDTANSTELNGRKTRLGGLTSGAHTLTVTATSGNSILEGVMVYDGDETKGLRQWDCAHVGFHAGNYAGSARWSNSLANLCVPDLAFVALGLNDYSAQMDPVTYRANVESIIARLKGINANVSIVLHNSWERGGVTNPTYPWPAYTAALREIADADPQVYLVDLNAQLLGWDHVDPAYRTIWDADMVHINNTGYRVVANVVAGDLLS